MRFARQGEDAADRYARRAPWVLVVLLLLPGVRCEQVHSEPAPPQACPPAIDELQIQQAAEEDVLAGDACERTKDSCEKMRMACATLWVPVIVGRVRALQPMEDD